MEIRFLGQNCFLISYNGKTIITDPFYNYQKEKSGFDIATQRINFVLITHAHADHTADVQEVLQHHPDASLIAQPEIYAYFSHSKSIDLNIGGTAHLGELMLSMVPAAHTSSFPDGSYGGTVAGFVLRMPEYNLYLSGDTGAIADMGLLEGLYGKINLSILCIGGHYTMSPQEATFAASKLIKTPRVIGAHFDTFPPISIDHKAAVQVFKENGVELLLPELGQSFHF